ncbi:hypothetical protein [Streptomyces nigrescens]
MPARPLPEPDAPSYCPRAALSGHRRRTLEISLAVAVPLLLVLPGTVDRLQKAYRDADAMRGAPLPEDRLVDRGLDAEAVGHRLRR